MNSLPPASFVNDPSFVFPEPVYRREFLKLRHALKAFDSISEQTQDWVKSANLRFIERQSSTLPGAVEIVGRIDALPPVEDWWFQASDAFSNLRDALDQLNHGISLYVSGVEPGRIRFPMATKGSQWRSWIKMAEAAGYPTWLIARYKNFQPYISQRPMLTTLETIANKEKHREGVAAALSLERIQFAKSSFKAVPPLPEDFDESLVQSKSAPMIDLVAAEFLVVTTSIPGHSLEVAETQQPANFHFPFVLRVDGDEIPLEGAVQRITDEVLWAACHVVGRTVSGTVPPKVVDLSLAGD